jgi:hypothetical protein
MREQVNIGCFVPGKLSVRKGFATYTFPTSATKPSSVPGTPVSMFRMVSSNGESAIWQTDQSVYIGGMDGSTTAIETSVGTSPSSFCQTRKGHLIRVNGSTRGSIRIGSSTYKLGITAPSKSPTITASTSGNSYEATYYCAYRFRDSNGFYSSLSPLAEVSATTGQSFLWSGIDRSPSDEASRITGIELYRSTADQQLTLYLAKVIEDPSSTPSAAAATILTTAAGHWTYPGATTVYLTSGIPVSLASGTKLMFYGGHANRGFPVEVELSAAALSGDTTLTIKPLVGSSWIPLFSILPGFTAAIAPSTPASEFTDTLSDATLLERTPLPIYFDDGSLCARRFDPPPTSASVVVPFQDRHFYAVQSSTNEDRNLLYYSERDEPESVPKTQNVLIVADDQEDADALTAMFTHNSGLYLAKNRHLYRMTFSYDPRFDGAVRLVCSRGILHQRAWTLCDDQVYAIDQFGAWRMSGGQVESISEPIQNYWREGLLDFNNASKWFVAHEPNEQVIRFFVLLATTDSDHTYPPRALVYSVRTGAWWMEEYPFECGSVCRATKDGRVRMLVGVNSSILLMSDGIKDLQRLDNGLLGSKPITYRLKTGYIEIPQTEKSQDPRIPVRQLVLAYTPTTLEETTQLRVYWDHEDDTPAVWWEGAEAGASASLRAQAVTVNMKRGRSIRGNAPGRERWPFRVRADAKALTHRFFAVEMEGSIRQEAHTIHALGVEGE